MKQICDDCGRKALVFRRVTRPGRHKGRLKIFTDKQHTLCFRCHTNLKETLIEKTIKTIEKVT
jgi:hypothetical protein